MANYINNKDLHAALSAWIYDYRAADEDGQPLPAIPEVVGESAFKIAKRVASRGNFANYSFKEDLISDALLSVVLYLKNYAPEKSTNAFSYLTTIITNAFVRRIESEAKQTFIKCKMSQHLSTIETYSKQPIDRSKYRNSSIEHDVDTANDVIERYETKTAAKTADRKARYGRPSKAKVDESCEKAA